MTLPELNELWNEGGWRERFEQAVGKKLEMEEPEDGYDPYYLREVDGSKYSHVASHFYVAQLPGCCGVLVVHNLQSVHRGAGRLMLEFIEEAARLNGYSQLLGTTNDEMPRMDETLRKSGWQEMADGHFTNLRTDNPVKFWTKFIRTDEGDEEWRQRQRGDDDEYCDCEVCRQ